MKVQEGSLVGAYYSTRISKKLLPVVKRVSKMHYVKFVHQSETNKAHLYAPVRSIDGPRLGFDPIRVGSCVPGEWKTFPHDEG